MIDRANLPKVENPALISLINEAKLKMDEIIGEQHALNDKIRNLEPLSHSIYVSMNAEYGVGGWQQLDTKDLSFIPKNLAEEHFYMVVNPDLRPKIVPDDVEVSVTLTPTEESTEEVITTLTESNENETLHTENQDGEKQLNQINQDGENLSEEASSEANQQEQVA